MKILSRNVRRILTAGALLAAAPGAGCAAKDKPAVAGVHFSLTGPARETWKEAARSVLRDYCGVTDLSDEAVRGAAKKLQTVNDRHLKEDVAAIRYTVASPRAADHRLGQFLRNDTEIFVPLPGVICRPKEKPSTTATETPPATTPASVSASSATASAPPPASGSVNKLPVSAPIKPPVKPKDFE